jgi:L-malate glycosyltransferase
MSLGIPTIAQAIGANYRIITNDYNGVLVHEMSDWVFAIKKIINNSNYRRHLSRNGINTVRESYSVSANFSKYLDVLK